MIAPAIGVIMAIGIKEESPSKSNRIATMTEKTGKIKHAIEENEVRCGRGGNENLRTTIGLSNSGPKSS